MSLPPVEITDQAAWEAILTALPRPHTLQSWDWGDFKSRWEWRAVRLAWMRADGTPAAAAAAQVLRRSIGQTPWCMLYVSKGPAADYTDLALTERVLADIETYARQQRAIFVKIDPDVPLAYGPAEAAEAYLPGRQVRELLAGRGWRYSSQQIQFKNTVLLDLTPSEAELLAAMKPKCRYNIRLAERKGVTVRPGGPADLGVFFELYAVTGRRDGFLIRPEAYYLDVWQQYLRAGRGALLLAEVEGTAVAGVLLFYLGGTAWYMYGASDNAHRNLMPNHLLQWEAIRWARAQNCTLYDFWGAPNHFDPSDSMWGVYNFKLGFGGVTRHGLGAFDYPVYPLLYKIYMQGLPKLLSLLRRNPRH